MHSLYRVAATLIAVIAIAILGVSPALAYPSGSDGNHPSSWEGQFEVPTTCVKFEAGDDVSSVGFWSGATGVVLNVDAVALILKSALVNDVYLNPIPGNLYVTQSGKDISHIIVCMEAPTSTPSPEPSTSPSPQPSDSPAPSASPSPSPSSSPTPSPSTSPTPTPTSQPSLPPESTPTPAPTLTPGPTPTPDMTMPPTDTEGNPSETPSERGWAFWLAVGIVGLLTGVLILSSPSSYGRDHMGKR